jgi:hypothetical protein
MPTSTTPAPDDWRLHSGVAYSEANKPPDTETIAFAHYLCDEAS